MDMNKLNYLSEKVLKDDFTEIEFDEFRALLEEWNLLIESTPTSYFLHRNRLGKPTKKYNFVNIGSNMITNRNASNDDDHWERLDQIR